MTDIYSELKESNIARERIHTVVWQKAIAVKVFQAPDLGSETRPQMEISATIWDVKCVMGQWLTIMIRQTFTKDDVPGTKLQTSNKLFHLILTISS